MDVVICIRKTENWLECEVENLRRHAGKTFDVPLDTLILSIKAWNRVLNMPYFEFRHRIKELALRNLSEVQGATVYQTVGDPDLDYLRSLEDTLIVLNDDDDYQHPQLAARLLDVFRIDEPDMLIWGGLVNQSYPQQMIFRYLKAGVPGSNQYAIHSKALPKFTDKELFRFLHQHVDSQSIAGRKGLRILELNDLLSCYNSHCGGCFYLSSSNGLHTLLRDFKSCKEMPGYQEFQKEIAVFEPYIDELNQILNEIRPKGSFARIKP